MFSCRDKTDKSYSDSFAYLEKEFKNPGRRYRSAPLWVWNTEVNEARIDQMLLDFKEKGFGGVFIHPRPGLISEYLSDNWFELCAYSLKKGKELDLDIWIYDENSYPSGFAGGHVPDQMPESYNQGQMLNLEKVSRLPEVIEDAYLILRKSENGFEEIIGKTDQWKNVAGSYYIFRKENYRTSPWYGGFSYVDVLVPGVTEKFLEITMQGYEKALGHEFGKHVPGVFTDEPNIEVQGRGNIRWTPDLFAYFENMWGYRLETHLPSLYEETGDWRKIRHNYYQTLLLMFIERWAEPWYAYTEAKGLEWTGHYWEHGWPNPNHGPDHMAMYAWHQRPAIDMLFNQFNEGNVNAQFGNIRAVKELSSVANQMGRRRTLSETYGGAGWEITFADMKRLGDWQYALGVNTLNQHLSYMSIIGARKYDYPPSFSDHNPWWPYYKEQNLYFARLSLALSRGQQVNDLLVIEPTTSAWMYAAYQNAHQRMRSIGQEFQHFVTRLEKNQIEYDLGSENIMKDHARVSGKAIMVGQRSYTTIVLPPGTESLDLHTFNLMKNFIEAGGKVVSFARPNRIDGALNDAWEAIYSHETFVTEEAEVSDEMIKNFFGEQDIIFEHELEQNGNLYHHRRILKDGQLLFLANVSLDTPCKGSVKLRGNYAVWLDAEKGEIFNLPVQAEHNFIRLDFQLPPAGSALYFISTQKKSDNPLAPVPAEASEPLTLKSREIRRLSPNVLTIDFCDVEIGGNWLRDIHTYFAADTVFKYHGFEHGNPWNTSVQFKQQTVERDTFSVGTGFNVQYHFQVAEGVDLKNAQAVVERPGLWTVKLNGTVIEPIPNASWLDAEMRLFDIEALIREGENTLELQANPMRVHAEIEPVYILGDFHIEPAGRGFQIVPAKTLKMGDWSNQGLHHYGHEVVYTMDFESAEGIEDYVLSLEEWKGTTARVMVNGDEAGLVSLPPYNKNISPWVKKGLNTVEVIVTGSLKNTLGPHHGRPTPGLVSPWLWRRQKHYPAGDQYEVYPYGLYKVNILTAHPQ
ncbi:MAG: hypothetical protein JJU28_18665 [Cyclobacteriaceae bacterium]|nr:hypothetical protein [Cyclobacteriaceae bacterium]